MKKCFILPFILIASIIVSCGEKNSPEKESDLKSTAMRLALDNVIIDTHIDVPYRLRGNPADISQKTGGGHFDYPRASTGGLNAAFMSIYVPASYDKLGGAKFLADSLIDMVKSWAETWRDKFAIATSPVEVRQHSDEGKFSLAMGIENGTAIESDIKNLKHFHKRGIRYITLAHSKNNRICDSATDKPSHWNGLSPFGEEVVHEMNRLGIMIDVSHISDESFYQIMEITRAPVIASHSACRAFSPGFERNMSDDMIMKLAENGGVIQIAFGSYFISSEYRTQAKKAGKKIKKYLEDHQLSANDPEAKIYKNELYERYLLATGSISDIVNHIDHVVKLVGVEHVGFGSDFDGVRGLPEGVEDVRAYPNIIHELLKNGYSKEDIKKICAENLLRVWTEVEKTAAEIEKSSG